MARPKRLRRLTYSPPAFSFFPSGARNPADPNDAVTLTMDEFESLRLADLECCTQKQAARKMNVSRATFGRIVESGRSKVARALVHGCCLEISGGAFMFGRGGYLQCPRCKRRMARDARKRGHVECRRCCLPLQNSDEPQGQASHESYTGLQSLERRTDMDFKNAVIAIVTDDGRTVSSHFGRAPFYQVITLSDGKVVKQERRQKAGHHNFASQEEPGEHGHDHGESHERRHQTMVSPIMDCAAVICRGMGQGAVDHLLGANLLPVLTGLHTIDEVINAIATDSLDHDARRIHQHGGGQ